MVKNVCPAKVCPAAVAAPRAVKEMDLQNFENGEKQRDTLCMKACPVNPCSTTKCHGSVMNPPHMTVDPTKDKQTVEEIRRLAVDFIAQFYDSINSAGSEQHQWRSAQVLQEIDSRGTYELTGDELIFGAKTAWRNAPRCIGRIQWNRLEVFDCRRVRTTQEMYQAMCKQLEFATNGGNIRSAITFFPPRTELSTEFRVWNAQLIRYAAYRQPDNSIVGDPANLEFTELCERLGWKGKGGMFDVLPWLLQANGQDPELYDVPSELVLEVKLRHPRFDWMEDTGLRWYAVPGVTNMMINIGGIEFSACPFNGWFMGTEIGRDLCDVQRYNLLPELAEKMGFDTNRTSSLWKDSAIVEINIAIIHSFQSDGVTIMDHHVASESFMKHFAHEMKHRGGCPGDWVWLVPPISGAVTPMFHQEIMNYLLNPACLYQPEPWRYYQWKNAPITKKKPRNKIHFKTLAKIVLMTAHFMVRAMRKRSRATILYATETGKSYAFAQILKTLFDRAFNARVVVMDEYDVKELTSETLVLVVTSTFGNGNPPENGEDFGWSLLEMAEDCGGRLAMKKSRRFKSSTIAAQLENRARSCRAKLNGMIENCVTNLWFSVFGVGSTAYPEFCAFAHAVDTLLGNLTGAERLLEIGVGDEMYGQEQSFKKWSQLVFGLACKAFSIECPTAAVDRVYTSHRPKEITTSILKADEEVDYVTALSKIHRKPLWGCKISSRQQLQSDDSERSTILVEIDTKDTGLPAFKPGDHLGVYPRNDPKQVQELISCLVEAPKEYDAIPVQVLKTAKKPWDAGEEMSLKSDVRLPVCTLHTALSRYLDICTPPTLQMLIVFSECARDPREKARLLSLSEGGSAYEDWKVNKAPTLIEVLRQFPSIRMTATTLFSQLPLLQCRYYSISSSLKLHPDQVHCTVGVLKYRTEGGKGVLHEGVCSTFFARTDHDEVIPCFVKTASSFHLPEDDSLPCILVGAGCGIAPFRSFWQQRLHEVNCQNKNRTMVLLFGSRHPDKDNFYKTEVEECIRKGAISHAFTAFSRASNAPKKYVQHVLEHEIPDLVRECIVERGGHFYVCGDVTMAGDVNRALFALLKEAMGERAAELYVAEMRADDRYHEDIFGIGNGRTTGTCDVGKCHLEHETSCPDGLASADAKSTRL